MVPEPNFLSPPYLASPPLFFSHHLPLFLLVTQASVNAHEQAQTFHVVDAAERERGEREVLSSQGFTIPSHTGGGKAAQSRGGCVRRVLVHDTCLSAQQARLTYYACAHDHPAIGGKLTRIQVSDLIVIGVEPSVVCCCVASQECTTKMLLTACASLLSVLLMDLCGVCCHAGCMEGQASKKTQC